MNGASLTRHMELALIRGAAARLIDPEHCLDMVAPPQIWADEEITLHYRAAEKTAQRLIFIV